MIGPANAAEVAELLVITPAGAAASPAPEMVNGSASVVAWPFRFSVLGVRPVGEWGNSQILNFWWTGLQKPVYN